VRLALAGTKPRLHKVLTEAGVGLGAGVSDIHGPLARAIVRGIVQAPHESLPCAGRRVRGSQVVRDALQGELTASHPRVPGEPLRHIEELEARIPLFDAGLSAGHDVGTWTQGISRQRTQYE
jgi:hypothetical protein